MTIQWEVRCFQMQWPRDNAQADFGEWEPFAVTRQGLDTFIWCRHAYDPNYVSEPDEGEEA